MVKKIIIDEEFSPGGRNTNRNRRSRPYPENTEKYPRFQEEPFRKNARRPGATIVETKLFTNRDELVAYVNEKGQSEALIDIYKIEDDLYKLVIKR